MTDSPVGVSRVDVDRRRVDPALVETVEHEPAELVVADHRGERRAHAEPGEPARDDRRAAAEQQVRARRAAAPPARTAARCRR